MTTKSLLIQFIEKCLLGAFAIVLINAMTAIASLSPGDDQEQ